MTRLLSLIIDLLISVLLLPVLLKWRVHERRVLFDAWEPGTDCDDEDVQWTPVQK